MQEYLDKSLAKRLAGRIRLINQGRTERLRLPVWSSANLTRAALVPLEYGLPSKHLPAVFAVWDELLSLTDEATGARDSVREQCGPGWSTRVDGGYIDEVSNAGIITIQMASLAFFATSRPELFNDDEQSEADRFGSIALRICRHYLPEIEDDGGLLFFRSRIDGRVEPFNHVHPYAGACGLLGRVYDDADLLDAGMGFWRTFQSLVQRTENGTVWWPYRPQVAGTPMERGEQVWKALTTLLLPLNLRHIEPSADAFVRNSGVSLFHNRICAGRKGDVPQFEIFIGNHKGRRLERQKIKTEGRQERVERLSEWAAFGQFDPRVTAVIREAVEKRPDLFPTGWTKSSRVLVGLSHALAQSAFAEIPASKSPANASRNARSSMSIWINRLMARARGTLGSRGEGGRKPAR